MLRLHGLLPLLLKQYSKSVLLFRWDPRVTCHSMALVLPHVLVLSVDVHEFHIKWSSALL
jgi:hypothetical protein